MEDRPDFKRVPFGVSPSKVSAYLRQMKHLQEQEATELEYQIQLQLAEQKRLQAEQEQLIAQKKAKTSRLKYQDLLVTRADEALQAMQQHTRQELDKLQRLVDQKRIEHEQKIAAVEQQTDYYNQTLQRLLQEVGATMQKFNSSALDQLDEAFAQVTVTSEPDPEPDPDEQMESQSDKVIQFKQKAQSESEPITMLRNGTHDVAQTETGEHVMARMEMAATRFEPAPRPVKVEVTETMSTAFWGNIQQYVTGHETVYEQPVMQVTPEVESVPVMAAAPVAAPVVASELKLVPIPAEPSKESEAVSAEINSIRNRYIVGKIAGADLLDHQGHLIIAKGATISAEVVDIAQREGKLPDLIVNMQMPGVSEE